MSLRPTVICPAGTKFLAFASGYEPGWREKRYAPVGEGCDGRGWPNETNNATMDLATKLCVEVTCGGSSRRWVVALVVDTLAVRPTGGNEHYDAPCLRALRSIEDSEPEKRDLIVVPKHILSM